MERQPHNNPWAEKLLQVSMPDSREAWVDMEAILDKEMPQRRDRRRWFLLILLLLLLIGVCNCPGRGRLFHNIGYRTDQPAGQPVAPPAGQPVDHRTNQPAAHPAGSPVTRPAAQPGHTPITHRTDHPVDHLATRPGNFDDTSRMIAGKTRITNSTTPKNKTTTPPQKIKRKPTTSRHRGRTSSETPEGENSGIPVEKNSGTPEENKTSGSTTADSIQTEKRTPDSTVTPDSTKTKKTPSPQKQKKKPVPPPQEPEEKEKEHGWVGGIGLNQFFPIGGQNGSTYHTDGLTGTLSDYLPVPMIRYYFNHRLYIQLEAQLNTPQPTKKNLVFNSPLPDTTTIRGTRIVSSASIQQLYYFNIPLSIHYALSDKLNIGAGLQFSHLSNAIGNFDSTLTNTNTSVVTDTKSTKSFKDDTLYHRIRTNELRFLIDVNYTYKRFVLGLRYNQALSKFIDVQLPTGGATAARNSSLQLYLRYILFDTRKKKTKKVP